LATSLEREAAGRGGLGAARCSTVPRGGRSRQRRRGRGEDPRLPAGGAVAAERGQDERPLGGGGAGAPGLSGSGEGRRRQHGEGVSARKEGKKWEGFVIGGGGSGVGMAGG
jgi:hypothetical protein